MLVATKWFGEIEIEKDKIITFEKGLMGFEEYKEYTIIYDAEKSEEQSVVWLQSIENKDLAIPAMHPEIIIPGYDPVIEDELLKGLGDIKNANLVVLVTLTVPSDIEKMTSNMKAPIIINSDNLKGCQIIANNENYEVKYPIYDLLQTSEKGGE